MKILTILAEDYESRVHQDRLELLSALIASPTFDPLFRDEVIRIPPDHYVLAWACNVPNCERPRSDSTDKLCSNHHRDWLVAAAAKQSMLEFLAAAEPLSTAYGANSKYCRICKDRAAFHSSTLLCKRHHRRWYIEENLNGSGGFEDWLSSQEPLPGYGTCLCLVCYDPAASPLGLCHRHADRYVAAGKPGGAELPWQWARNLEPRGHPVRVHVENPREFKDWCAKQSPIQRIGVLNLLGLQPVLSAEIRWGLYAHTLDKDPMCWQAYEIQRLINHCREQGHGSLFDFEAELSNRKNVNARVAMIAREIIDRLRPVYFSPLDTRDAGFIETDHFGHRFPTAASYFDLSGVQQPWLRDLLWDHLAELLRSPNPPRSRGPFDSFRRAAVELSAFLELNAPEGGKLPPLLTTEHAQGFVADQRRREKNKMASLGVKRPDKKPSIVTSTTRRIVFNHIRKLLYSALESGRADEIQLPRDFITAFPYGGSDSRASRNPYSDDVARALADEANLTAFAAKFDPYDRGLRDVWEVILATGRRCSEVLLLRLDCVGRCGSLPMLWHDQTKVGNLNAGIRIPERIYALIVARQEKTLVRFEGRQGRRPTAAERRDIALFPSRVRNRSEQRAISYGFFSRSFSQWVQEMDLPPSVPHQARHTLATNLLRAGATLTHIRRYLGQVSDRMAEHYVTITDSDLEGVLQTLWVAGPSASEPGRLLSTPQEPLNREEARNLAIDLSRRSAPADGGFCTFQPVVKGSACPWNLNCHGCDKFVMSGADLVYWRRKQEQWRSIAERAPDDVTADYLHKVFEPTARAIAGLERALSSVGLLEEALTLDLRRPQDYFNRVWNTAFSVADLGELADAGSPA